MAGRMVVRRKLKRLEKILIMIKVAVLLERLLEVGREREDQVVDQAVLLVRETTEPRESVKEQVLAVDLPDQMKAGQVMVMMEQEKVEI